MSEKNRYLNQIVPHLEKKYGKAKTDEIMRFAWNRYHVICEENAEEPKSHYMHTRQRIYPAIAVFDAMLKNGIDRQETADFLIEYYKWRSGGVAPKVKMIFKIPGLYKIVPKFFFNMTQKSFGPQMGFGSENKYLSKEEMRFDMVVCPYQDKCVTYGCPEIVKGFCEADDVLYGELHPKLKWGRTKTLGKGGDCCDFKITIEG